MDPPDGDGPAGGGPGGRLLGVEGQVAQEPRGRARRGGQRVRAEGPGGLGGQWTGGSGQWEDGVLERSLRGLL